MRGLEALGNPGPVAHRVGDAVLWVSADGEPLGVTEVVPVGATAPWAAVAAASGTSAEATRHASAFVAALRPAGPVGAGTTSSVADGIEFDLHTELATLDYLARLSA